MDDITKGINDPNPNKSNSHNMISIRILKICHSSISETSLFLKTAFVLWLKKLAMTPVHKL